MKKPLINEKHLNILYGIEVLNGRLNLSSPEVEQRKDENNTTSYVKKIGGRAYVSAPCIKQAIQGYMRDVAKLRISKKTKVENKVISPANPYVFSNEDLFGFMMLGKITLSKEQYDCLSKDEQMGYSSNGKKGYTKNITKKRKARFMLSPAINVSNRRINTEYNVCTTDSYSLPYKSEVYSGILVGYGNMDINNVGKFIVSNDETAFRDYSVEEEEISETDVILSKTERFTRIEAALRGLEYLQIKGNRTNNLTDTGIKIVILGEYSWGNNLFQGVITKDGIDAEILKETLEENEQFRMSPVWIGFSQRLSDDKVKESLNNLKEALKEYDFINIGSIKNSFDGYLEYLKKSYK